MRFCRNPMMCMDRKVYQGTDAFTRYRHIGFFFFGGFNGLLKQLGRNLCLGSEVGFTVFKEELFSSLRDDFFILREDE